jgi:DNA-directed RNA polymerase subunit M/transcription elongation factor TFIIS
MSIIYENEQEKRYHCRETRLYDYYGDIDMLIEFEDFKRMLVMNDKKIKESKSKKEEKIDNQIRKEVKEALSKPALSGISPIFEINAINFIKDLGFPFTEQVDNIMIELRKMDENQIKELLLIWKFISDLLKTSQDPESNPMMVQYLEEMELFGEDEKFAELFETFWETIQSDLSVIYSLTPTNLSDKLGIYWNDAGYIKDYKDNISKEFIHFYNDPLYYQIYKKMGDLTINQKELKNRVNTIIEQKMKFNIPSIYTFNQFISEKGAVLYGNDKLVECTKCGNMINIPFTDLPEDWICKKCGSTKEDLKELEMVSVDEIVDELKKQIKKVDEKEEEKKEIKEVKDDQKEMRDREIYDDLLSDLIQLENELLEKDNSIICPYIEEFKIPASSIFNQENEDNKERWVEGTEKCSGKKERKSPSFGKKKDKQQSILARFIHMINGI